MLRRPSDRSSQDLKLCQFCWRHFGAKATGRRRIWELGMELSDAPALNRVIA
jgi:hypothetical protein